MSASFFSWPMASLTKTINLISDAVRSLPDEQLAGETVQLQGICEGQGEHLAEHVLLAVYHAEKSRRQPGAVNAGSLRLVN